MSKQLFERGELVTITKGPHSDSFGSVENIIYDDIDDEYEYTIQLHHGPMYKAAGHQLATYVEMANIWDPQHYEGLDLDVYSSEGMKDHFHLTGPEKFFVNGTPNTTCIRISVEEYFHHGKHQGVLNSSGKKRLVKYLSQVNSRGEELRLTNWQAVAFAWNIMNHERTHVSGDVSKMPNYENL